MALFTNDELVKILNINAQETGISPLDSADNYDMWVRPIITQPKVFNKYVSNLIENFVYRSTETNMFTSAFDFFRERRDGAGFGTYETVINPVFPLAYDMTAFDRVLKYYPPDVKAQYFAINRAQTFPQSINKKECRKAFTTLDGVNDFLEKLIIAPRNGNTIIENNSIKEMINANIASNAIKHIDIDLPTNKSEWENLAQKIQEIAIGMCSEPSTEYNNYENIEGANGAVWAQSRRDDLVFIGDKTIISAIKTYVLATAFSQDDVDFKFKFIPLNDTGYLEYNETTQSFGTHHNGLFHFIICDGGFLKLEDNFESDLSNENIFTNGMQRALNIEQTYGIRAYRNAVAFTVKGSTLENISTSVDLTDFRLTASSPQIDGNIVTTPDYYNGDFNIDTVINSAYYSTVGENIVKLTDEQAKAITEMMLTTNVVDKAFSIEVNENEAKMKAVGEYLENENYTVNQNGENNSLAINVDIIIKDISSGKSVVNSGVIYANPLKMGV